MADFKTKDIEEQMKGKTRCTKCGKILANSNNFYTSNSKLNTHTKRTSLCKDCLTNFYVAFLEETNDTRISIYKLCKLVDFVYLENIYESSLTEAGWNKNFTIIENGLAVWKKYIKTINSLTNYKGLTFEHGDKIYDNAENSLSLTNDIENKKTIEDIEKSVKPKELTDEEIEKKAIYRQNKIDVIKILGYDPFENELEENKPKMFAMLVNMLSEDIQEDTIKVGATLDVIRTRNQIEKIDDAIVSLNKDTKNIIDNMGSVGSLVKTKQLLSKTLTDTVKENRMVEHKSAGANAFTGKEKKIKNLDLEAIQVNLYDQETSMGMQQVADISLRASIRELNFGDDTLSEIVKMQTQEIDKIRMDYKGLKEENRRLKSFCNLNKLKYKDYILKEDWQEELLFNKDEFEKEINNRTEVVKQVSKMSVDEYSEKLQKQKEEEYKNKIKNELIKNKEV